MDPIPPDDRASTLRDQHTGCHDSLRRIYRAAPWQVAGLPISMTAGHSKSIRTMSTLELFDPTGSTEVTHLHAPRLDALAGRTIAMISDDMWQTHRMLPLIARQLESQFDGLRVIPETEFPMGTK